MKLKLVLLIGLISFSILSQSRIISEEIFLLNDSIQLPGTLTYSKAELPQPLVIFVHGSGNVDRNGNQGTLANANYIKLLSEALNKNGIAFYRYDKRTATRSNLKFLVKGLTINKFTKDLQLAINHFKNDKRFSGITLIGHSQGSLIAMLALTADIKKYISLAGPSKSIDVVMTSQIRDQNGDVVGDLVESHFKELKTTGVIANVNPNLLSLFNKSNQPFFKSWMAYIPEEEIKNITIPILILNGTKDIQVSVDDANNLHKANPKSKLVVINNMNHVLKTILKDEDNIKSYTSPEFSLSEDLVIEITKFINE